MSDRPMMADLDKLCREYVAKAQKRIGELEAALRIANETARRQFEVIATLEDRIARQRKG